MDGLQQIKVLNPKIKLVLVLLISTGASVDEAGGVEEVGRKAELGEEEVLVGGVFDAASDEVEVEVEEASEADGAGGDGRRVRQQLAVLHWVEHQVVVINSLALAMAAPSWRVVMGEGFLDVLRTALLLRHWRSVLGAGPHHK
uniref:DUF834 domain-containing protein n=1 Tax=Oryza barthii TaxID=65489 RepID=A0A0D3GBW4_9ORYZ